MRINGILFQNAGIQEFRNSEFNYGRFFSFPAFLNSCIPELQNYRFIAKRTGFVSKINFRVISGAYSCNSMWRLMKRSMANAG
jgi:hypothetical protein